MRDALVKLALAQGQSAIGSFVRWWLLATGALAAGAGMLIVGGDGHTGIDQLLVGALIGLFAFSIPLAVPVAVAIAIIAVALKW